MADHLLPALAITLSGLGLLAWAVAHKERTRG